MIVSLFFRLRTASISLGYEILTVSWALFKILIPIMILIKILEELGAIEWLAWLLGPIMGLVGLPESMGLVWATTLLTSMYAGVGVFFLLAPTEMLTVAQVTVLACLMLIAHGIPVEVRIAQKAGVRWWFTALLRFGGALVFGMLLHWIFTVTQTLQQPNQLIWMPEQHDDSLLAWIGAQTQSLMMIVVIIAVLLTVLRILKAFHIERLMIKALQPVLRWMGIGPEATTLTIVGVTLGLTFGAGLLIKEAQAGTIPKRDIWASMSLLALCHSIIEDTLFMMLLGAHLSGILWGRMLFAFVVTALLVWALGRWVDRFMREG